MNEETLAFFMGIMVGVVVLSTILGGCNATHTDGKVEVQTQAVEHGYGKWVVKTNSAGFQPGTKFEWNK